jgi:hypothetical protein
MESMMKRLNHVILFSFVVFALASCKEAPVTERKQLILIPESSEMKMGADAFRRIKKEAKLSTNLTLMNQINKVGNRRWYIFPPILLMIKELKRLRRY